MSGFRGSFQRKERSELDWNPGRRNRTFSSCPLTRAQRNVGAEHIRETRAKILAAKKEIKEYLRLPEDARGLLILILTHGKGNVIFLNQENLPTGAERKYTWEEYSGQYTTELITVYDYESMYMTAVDVDGNESATFVCLAKNKGNFEIFFFLYKKIDKKPKSLKTPLAKCSYYC